MHALIASFAYCFLLFTEGYAQREEGYRSKKNVPEKAKEALLDAINEIRRSLDVPTLERIEYDYKLAKKSSVGTSGGLKVLDGESEFKDSWKETMKNALTSSGNKMIRVAEKIGCEITLSTSTTDGSHKLRLHCNLQVPNFPIVVDGN